LVFISLDIPIPVFVSSIYPCGSSCLDV